MMGWLKAWRRVIEVYSAIGGIVNQFIVDIVYYLH